MNENTNHKKKQIINIKKIRNKLSKNIMIKIIKQI